MDKVNLIEKLSEEEKRDLALDKARRDGDKYKYLIILKGEFKDSEDGEWRNWELVQGRQAAYDLIKEYLESESDPETDVIIDVTESYIISQPPVITEKTPRITFDNMLTIYRFMQEMLIKNLVKDESAFSIEDYYDGE